MVARINHCQPERLRLALEARLPADEQENLERHLPDCESCRQSLEALAGDAAWWREARTTLGTETLVDGSNFNPSGLHAFVVRSEGAPASVDRSATNGLDGASHLVARMLTPSDQPQSLGRLGAYEVTEVLGRGGSGIVLKGYDAALNRHVAIKVLAAELAASGSARQRFAREAQAAAAVVHEHVVSIHAIDAAAGYPYLVMSYIPGKSLQERLDQHGPLELKEILRVGMQTAAGLAAAHAQGLVHRDIKPANILLEDGVERVKITDFGLARAVDDASQTQSGVVAGTPQYMAPEQARGDAVDARADLFCLGSVLYAMATGRSPFRADNTLAVLRRVCEDEPRSICEISPDLPPWFERLVGRLLHKDRVLRLQTASEVAALLEQCLAHVQQPHSAPLPAVLAAPRKSLASGRRWKILGAIAVVMVSLGLGAWAWFDRSRPGPEDAGPADAATALRLSRAPSDLPALDIARPLAALAEDIDRLDAEIRTAASPHDAVVEKLEEVESMMQVLEADFPPDSGPPADPNASAGTRAE
jgi:serine/threonine-protein kinase